MITVDKQLVSDDSEERAWTFAPLHAPLEGPNYDTHRSVGFVYALERGGGTHGAAAVST